MANLSNINNVLRVSSDLRVGINTDAASYALEIGGTNSGIKLKNSDATNGRVYSLLSDTAGNFQIYDDAASSGRLVINNSGNATFIGSITVSGINSLFNTGGSGTFVTNDASGYPRITITSASAQLGLFRASDGGMYIGGSSAGFRVYNSSFAQKLLIDSGGGGATFSDSVTATNFIGPGQGLDNLLPLGVYSTTPGTAGVLIATNVVSNNYAFLFGTIKLEQFNQTSKQTIEFSATLGSNGIVVTKAATADVAITMKLFHVGGYWYIHLPMPSTYVTVSAYIYTGAGYQGQAKGFNEVSSITMNAVPSGATSSVDIVPDIYLTTGGSSPWFKNGNDIYNSNSANVGIGTNSPSNKLDVQISTSNRTTLEPVLSVSASGNGPYTGFGPKISFDSNIYYGAGTGNPAGIIETAYIGAVMGTTYATNSDLVFATRDGATSVTEKMRILGNGNVGIGTISPATKLEVNGGLIKLVESGNTAFYGGDYVRVFGTQSYGFRNSGGSSIALISLNGNSYFNGGNVGVGITNPQDTLHVNGDAIISSTRYGDFAVGSINTTGYAIANVATSTNGQSAIVEFVASGNNGGYYNVVYSIYNGGGLWYYTKNVVGSGGNIEVAETNGSGSSTLIFYFRSTSGTASYTPRVMMKASPYNYVTF